VGGLIRLSFGCDGDGKGLLSFVVAILVSVGLEAT